jgi:hypothetical protein
MKGAKIGTDHSVHAAMGAGVRSRRIAAPGDRVVCPDFRESL